MTKGYIIATVIQLALTVLGAFLISYGVEEACVWMAIAGGICWQIAGYIGGAK